MIKTLIVEDEPRSASYLEALIAGWCPQLTLLGTACNVKEARDRLDIDKPELILLDIELAGETAFTLLDYYREPDFKVIFTTAYEQYMLRALRAAAVDYLLKPIDYLELVEAVRRAQLQITQYNSIHNLELALQYIRNQSSTFNRLALPTMEGLIMVNTEDIISITADGNYSKFNLTSKKQFLISRNIQEYELLLENAGFMRIHHSHIIQINHLSRYIKGRGGQVIMSDGTALDVAERKKGNLIDMLRKLGY